MCIASVYGTNSAIQILCQYDKLSDLCDKSWYIPCKLFSGDCKAAGINCQNCIPC